MVRFGNIRSLWTMYHLTLISEVKEALKEILTSILILIIMKTSSYSINIYDNQIYGNNSFLGMQKMN